MTYSHRTEVTLYADETGHGIEFAGATSDLREPIPRHLLDVSTMDRQALRNDLPMMLLVCVVQCGCC